MATRALCLTAALLGTAACGGGERTGTPTTTAQSPTARPSILLITLDTTRADAIGPDATGLDARGPDATAPDGTGPDRTAVRTPAFNALAARGRRFRQAYATVPETLPSHSSMMTGLYPAGHGVHENARPLPAAHPVLAERLREAGYQTAAFVSSFVLTRRFGLARGFDVYDDEQPLRGVERPADQTTDRALAFLERAPAQPLFVWVHYFDPHTPYAPPEPFRTQYAQQPYLGEVAAMDAQIGRLVQAFEARVSKGAASPQAGTGTSAAADASAGARASGGAGAGGGAAAGVDADARRSSGAAIIVVADHGEGLGDHGEAQHGSLVYQSTMHVPLVVVGPGVTPGVEEMPVSTRRIFHTVLDWAGVAAAPPGASVGAKAGASAGTGAGGDAGAGAGAFSLRAPKAEVVLGEGMKPFLEYGWQPQIVAVEGRHKAIQTRRVEVYDVVADPGETRDLSAGATLSPALLKALDEYPVPSPDAARASDALNDEARRSLASLGYVSATTPPVIRKDAPRPADMTTLLDVLDRASTLFVQERYAQVIPLLEQILAADPHNLDAALRLATAHSALGQEARALAAFDKAAAIAPSSPDVRTYLALHYARGKDWARAVPLLEQILKETPERLPAIEALANLREKQGRAADAVSLRQQAYRLRSPTAAELIHLGRLAMETQQTQPAIEAFERARALQGGQPAAADQNQQARSRTSVGTKAGGTVFAPDLELGVLYLASRRFEDARAALDRVLPSHPEYPMALFKRAQVSVLLKEPDSPARIARAREGADATTRALIARERLFQR